MWKPIQPGTRTPKQLQAAVWGAVMGAFVVGLTTGTLLRGARQAGDWKVSIAILVLGLFLTIRAMLAASPPAD